jgi:hypothetical protein
MSDRHPCRSVLVSIRAVPGIALIFQVGHGLKPLLFSSPLLGRRPVLPAGGGKAHATGWHISGVFLPGDKQID